MAKTEYFKGPGAAAQPMPDLRDLENAESMLLARIARQERAALAEVYERFQRPLFRYLFRLLSHKEFAEDILQEVMLVVWQKAHTFKGNNRQAAGWIFGIAHHIAFKALRRETGKEFVDLETASDIADETAIPEADVLRSADAEAIATSLACLTPEHREVLDLAFYQDFSCKEIASITGVPEGTVKSRLCYARRALKTALLRNGWEV